MSDSDLQQGSTHGRIKKIGRLLALAAGIAFVYFWDDLFFSAPMLAASSIFGAEWSFLVLAPIYFTFDLLVSLGILRVYDRVTKGEPSRLERWLRKTGEEDAHSRKVGKSKWIVDQLLKGNWVSKIFFVLACFLLGAIAVIVILRYAGWNRNHNMVHTSFWAAFWFAVTFVGFYSGLPQVVINGLNSIF